MVCRSKYHVGTLLKKFELETNLRLTYYEKIALNLNYSMCHTKIVNRAYTLNSSFYLLFENFTTYNYKISYTSS